MSQTPMERLISYALAYEQAVNEYKAVALEAASNEAAHKSERAKAILRFKARTEPGKQRISQAEAESMAEADDTVADLYMARLTSAAIADAARQRLFQLREMVGVARTVVASERATDLHHSAGYTGAA
jgi:aminopeptidase N